MLLDKELVDSYEAFNSLSEEEILEIIRHFVNYTKPEIQVDLNKLNGKHTLHKV